MGLSRWMQSESSEVSTRWEQDLRYDSQRWAFLTSEIHHSCQQNKWKLKHFCRTCNYQHTVDLAFEEEWRNYMCTGVYNKEQTHGMKRNDITACVQGCISWSSLWLWQYFLQWLVQRPWQDLNILVISKFPHFNRCTYTDIGKHTNQADRYQDQLLALSHCSIVCSS